MTANRTFTRKDLLDRIERVTEEIAHAESVVKALDNAVAPRLKRVRANEEGLANSKAALKAAEKTVPRGQDAAKKRSEDIATIKASIAERSQLLGGLREDLKEVKSELEMASDHLDDMVAYKADLSKALKDLDDYASRILDQLAYFLYMVLNHWYPQVQREAHKAEKRAENVARHRAEKEARRAAKAAAIATATAETASPTAPAADPALAAIAAELGADLADPEQRKLIESLAAERAEEARIMAELEAEEAAKSSGGSDVMGPAVHASADNPM